MRQWGQLRRHFYYVVLSSKWREHIEPTGEDMFKAVSGVHGKIIMKLFKNQVCMTNFLFLNPIYNHTVTFARRSTFHRILPMMLEAMLRRLFESYCHS